MRICGLTGNIASGKSTVVAKLVEEGVSVIDCDVIAKEAVEKGTWGHRRVVSAFGPEVLAPDGSIDRERLGALVFGGGGGDGASGALRRKLNAATHLPITLRLLRSLFSLWLRCELVAVVDMALLYESGSWALTRPRVLVRCERGTQVRRAMARDGLDEAAARARVAAQAPPEGKARRSHCVLDNDGTVEELREAAARVLVWGEGEGAREGAGRNGEGEGNGGAPRRRPGSSSSSSSSSGSRRTKRRGLLFRGSLWHALVTPPALAAAVAVAVALLVTLW